MNRQLYFSKSNFSNREERYILLSVISSIVFHLGLLFFLIFKPENTHKPAVIYSVTLESGATKGGVTQLPDKNNKSDLAPIKKVTSTPEKVQPEIKKVVEEIKVKPVEKKIIEKKVEDAEVIIPKKVTPKATPTPVTTPKPTATPVPTKATTSATTKSTAVPTTAKVINKNTLPDANKNYQQALQRYLGASTAAGGEGFGGNGTTGQGVGGGILKSPEWFRYKALLESHVKKGWSWHDPRAELFCYIRFSIARNGEVSNIQITKSSGISAFDDSVYRAVARSTPVPPAPPSVYEDFKDVEIKFSPV